MSVLFGRSKCVLLRCWAPDLPAWSHGSSDEEEEEKQRRAPLPLESTLLSLSARACECGAGLGTNTSTGTGGSRCLPGPWCGSFRVIPDLPDCRRPPAAWKAMAWKGRDLSRCVFGTDADLAWVLDSFEPLICV